jgi:hypothetical protein
MKRFAVVFASASLAVVLMGGCFSYHSTSREYTAAPQLPPSTPPGDTTTTTTTQSNNGTVQQRSTTTYAP